MIAAPNFSAIPKTVVSSFPVVKFRNAKFTPVATIVAKITPVPCEKIRNYFFRKFDPSKKIFAGQIVKTIIAAVK